ncbi:hypothetical protein EDB86DRAFT_2959087 [Lactarius hatsudake]|nr:hypothetical protein EDB86DRAFT_2959087 [Lactarius hatsudake]
MRRLILSRLGWVLVTFTKSCLRYVTSLVGSSEHRRECPYPAILYHQARLNRKRCRMLFGVSISYMAGTYDLLLPSTFLYILE